MVIPCGNRSPPTRLSAAGAPPVPHARCRCVVCIPRLCLCAFTHYPETPRCHSESSRYVTMGREGLRFVRTCTVSTPLIRTVVCWLRSPAIRASSNLRLIRFRASRNSRRGNPWRSYDKPLSGCHADIDAMLHVQLMLTGFSHTYAYPTPEIPPALLGSFLSVRYRGVKTGWMCVGSAPASGVADIHHIAGVRYEPRTAVER